MTRQPPQAVCALERLVPERGAAVLVDGHQIALFRVDSDGRTRVYAVSHHDPFSDAHVIGRGIVGSAGDRVTVASPMYKQVFDLTTGECLSDAAVRLAVWETFVEEGVVHLYPEPASPPVSAASSEPVLEPLPGVAGTVSTPPAASPLVAEVAV